ncbi:cyclophilin-like fold protein [Nocardioides sp. 1609]|uniref:cyclophilin-like fold protein n=1 Tax=Nocardioides sp. 1609 TaxID=2508327 RepID=UPI00106FD49B|nr:cyclophilin-like fold protein [Nocardioides sp. 1609]
MRAFNRPATVLSAALVSGASALAGCGSDDGGAAASATSPAVVAGEPSDAPPASPAASAPTTTPQEAGTRIRIAIGTDRLTATLDDSAAGRDLVAQLPVTLDLTDHGAVEKTGPLPAALSLTGQPPGADPDVGDLGYYAPGQDLVLYYGDQSYYDGIVILGRLDGDAAERIAEVDGSLTATVTLVDG